MSACTLAQMVMETGHMTLYSLLKTSGFVFWQTLALRLLGWDSLAAPKKQRKSSLAEDILQALILVLCQLVMVLTGAIAYHLGVAPTWSLVFRCSHVLLAMMMRFSLNQDTREPVYGWAVGGGLVAVGLYLIYPDSAPTEEGRFLGTLMLFASLLTQVITVELQLSSSWNKRYYHVFMLGITAPAVAASLDSYGIYDFIYIPVQVACVAEVHWINKKLGSVYAAMFHSARRAVTVLLSNGLREQGSFSVAGLVLVFAGVGLYEVMKRR